MPDNSPDRFTRASRTAAALLIGAMLTAAYYNTNILIVGLCILLMLVAVAIAAIAYGKS